MVFSSVPVYSDHPNWHQLDQPINQGCGSQNYPLWPPPPPPPPPQAGGGGGQIKPNSMVDRAQLAKVQQPEKGLKCPRCESNNTKFCYFNNYNLSQPRHFCKTCRRYWTKGGILRNIPVGGGCRKNKRSKSKSKSSKSHQVMITSASTTPSRCSTYTPNDFPSLSPHMQVPFMDSSLNCGVGNMGIIGFDPKMAAEGSDGGGEASFGFQTGISSNFLSVGGAEQWRLASLTGLEPPENFSPYQSEAAAVKMEENYSKLGLNLSRQFMGVSGNNDNQYWSGNQWQEISGLSSSPTSNLL